MALLSRTVGTSGMVQVVTLAAFIAGLSAARATIHGDQFAFADIERRIFNGLPFVKPALAQ